MFQETKALLARADVMTDHDFRIKQRLFPPRPLKTEKQKHYRLILLRAVEQTDIANRFYVGSRLPLITSRDISFASAPHARGRALRRIQFLVYSERHGEAEARDIQARNKEWDRRRALERIDV